MTKQAWQKHMTLLGFVTMAIRGSADYVRAKGHMASCEICHARQRQARANRNRREHDQALRDLGLVKTPYGWE